MDSLIGKIVKLNTSSLMIEIKSFARQILRKYLKYAFLTSPFYISKLRLSCVLLQCSFYDIT